MVNHSEMEFVVPGPGARDGIAKCFRDTGGLNDADVIRWVTETAPAHFARLGLTFVGRRSRIKQIFTPTPAPIEHRYPPKWGLPADVTASAR